MMKSAGWPGPAAPFIRVVDSRFIAEPVNSEQGIMYEGTFER